jgi:uncharacterized protein
MFPLNKQLTIIAPEKFVTMAWKNGGGMTHEVAKHEIAGKLAWRLSIADVNSDGPFSMFNGFSRILTVIEGAGLVLSAPHLTLDAMPLQPTAFPGEWPIDCRRLNGNVRDFNVIFDAVLFEAKVDVKSSVVIEPDEVVVHALVMLTEASVAGETFRKDTVLIVHGMPLVVQGPCLLVTLRSRLAVSH